jgi:hypothetical protein
LSRQPKKVDSWQEQPKRSTKDKRIFLAERDPDFKTFILSAGVAMIHTISTLLGLSFVAVGCINRDYNSSSKAVAVTPTATPNASGKATVRIESALWNGSPFAIRKVIGSEKQEASCHGGTPKFSVTDTNGKVPDLIVPTSVTEVWICGEASAAGYPWVRIDVREKLKEGEVTIIRNNEAVAPEVSDKATVRVTCAKWKGEAFAIRKVIGSEKQEASCLGGTPKYSVTDSNGKVPDLIVPTTVTEIWICGEASAAGYPWLRVDVAGKLKAGEEFKICQ